MSSKVIFNGKSIDRQPGDGKVLAIFAQYLSMIIPIQVAAKDPVQITSVPSRSTLKDGTACSWETTSSIGQRSVKIVEKMIDVKVPPLDKAVLESVQVTFILDKKEHSITYIPTHIRKAAFDICNWLDEADKDYFNQLQNFTK